MANEHTHTVYIQLYGINIRNVIIISNCMNCANKTLLKIHIWKAKQTNASYCFKVKYTLGRLKKLLLKKFDFR